MTNRQWSRRRFLAQMAAAAAATNGLAPTIRIRGADGVAAGASGTKERLFRASREVFPNPERGFYVQRATGRMRQLEELRPQAITLVLVTMDLRDFKDRDLTPAKLDELRQAMAAARERGVKVIFRAAYGFTRQDYRTDPKEMPRILGHIRQVGAVLAEERDVLYCVQAGFLGPWGEWHNSNWGGLSPTQARRNVLFALLDVVPLPIPVQVRTPQYIRDIFAGEPGGSELSEEQAYSGSRLSRTGWHNDAFLCLPTDMGTYSQGPSSWDRERELQWCKRHGRFTPFGGETVGGSASTPLEQVVREMELVHATYLNIGYHPATLQRWRETDYRGENAFEHIAQRLGYRFVARKLWYSAAVKEGEAFRFELLLENVGFAAPYLPRKVAAGLWRRGDLQPSYRVLLPDADPRRWGPEAGPIRLRGTIPVPAAVPPGTWRLGMQLADPADCLRDDGRYAIRLANEDITFTEQSGWNVLVEELA